MIRIFPRSGLGRLGFYLLVLIGAAYLAAAAYMAINQRSFLYKPAPSWIAPETQGIPRAEAIRLVSSPGDALDGPELRGWFAPPADERQPVYLYFHGNANGLDRRASRFRLLATGGAGFVALSHRGYGGSEGAPSEAALHLDAERAYAALLRKGFSPERIVIFGESLGTGIALNLARKVKAKAVILDSPYLSVLDRGQAEYPWLPVSWLLSDTFRSDLWISEIKTPILILHGDADRVIPVGDSARLAAKARNGNVIRKVYPGQPHVVPLDKGPMPDILAFLDGRLQ